MITKKAFKAFFTGSQDIEEDYFCCSGIYKKLKEKGYEMGQDNFLMFLAQVGHESSLLRHKVELWSYSRSALLRVFPKYFNEKNVDKYVRSPEVLNRAYSNRIGNGSESSGDGFNFRGRGYIQLTGRNNYEKYGYENNPEKLLNPWDAWKVSYMFWFNNKLDKETDFKKITRKINGGYNGWPHRQKLLKQIKSMV